MCSSMEDKNPQPTKPHKLNSEVPTNHANPSKLVNNFMYKATIFTVFLVILTLLPSLVPEFINSRILELFQLICVGIAVSYGLFSKKNEGNVDKAPHICSVFDNANTYINRLLQVSSVFDNEVENPLPSSDGNKLQSWSSQYSREEPIVMVANESPSLEEQIATSVRIKEKPLLLPVRSLKSRVSESNVAESSLLDRFDSNTNSSSNRFSENSRKSLKEDTVRVSPQIMEQNLEEKIVHPSPIPWRSRSGKMEMKFSEDSPLMEDSETQFRKSRLSCSFKFNSTSSSFPPPTRSSRFSYVASESKEDTVDNSVRRKIHYPISSTPPATPPPLASFLHDKPSLPKSNPGLSQNNDFLEMNLRSSVQSVKNDSNQTQSRKANSRSELRPIGTKSNNMDGKVIAGEIEGPIMEELMPCLKKESLMEYLKEDKKGFSFSESEEDGDFEKNTDNSKSARVKEETVNENANTDEGPDVNKKAEEFIAKFREQIRLQRTQ